MTFFPVASPETAMRFMWLGTAGLTVTFFCLLAGRFYGFFPGFLLAGAAAGFAADIYSAFAIGRGQFKRIRELPPRFDDWAPLQQDSARLVQRTTAIGLALLAIGTGINFVQSLFSIHRLDPLWGLLLLMSGMCIQLFGLARYLERLQ